jgi:hypothetical protein
VQYDPPGDDEWQEEYPPADSGFRSIYAPDDYDYSDYDEEWGTFNPDDEDWQAEQYRRLVSDFNIYYDMATRRWICDCARYVRQGACLHSYKYRGEEIVPVSERYL